MKVLNRLPEKVAEYKKGKKGLMGLFVGEVKKASKGKADPKLTNDIINKKTKTISIMKKIAIQDGVVAFVCFRGCRSVKLNREF